MIQKLVHGFNSFRKDYFLPNSDTYQSLQSFQSPFAMLIACSDSRVSPEFITGSKPGELFVVRNIANLVPPYEPDNFHHGVSAALEYGVKVLAVRDIVILGHSNCGGIRALLDRTAEMPRSEFIDPWLDLAEPAKQEAYAQMPDAPLPEKQKACEKISLRLSLANLLSFPWIKSKVEAGSLSLHAWYYDIAVGSLQTYDSSSDSFQAFDPP